jgi:hypothetical protein
MINLDTRNDLLIPSGNLGQRHWNHDRIIGT